MKYENRIPVEGANTPGRHPLREFFRLAVMAVLAVVLLGLTLNFAGGKLGSMVPFKTEQWLSRKIDQLLLESGQASPFSVDPLDTPVEQYLQSLADQVVTAMGVEESIEITLHYSEEDTANAYATIGGHVYLFNGLLSLLPHENALMMLMAHEISHVKLRHTARGVGGGLAVAIGSRVLGNGASLENRLIDLATMSFSRNMETDADQSGLAAVQQIYGHVAGATDLFLLFMQIRDGDDEGLLDSFFSTHPLDQQRIAALEEYATSQQWSIEGEVTALPAEFKAWLVVK